MEVFYAALPDSLTVLTGRGYKWSQKPFFQPNLSLPSLGSFAILAMNVLKEPIPKRGWKSYVQSHASHGEKPCGWRLSWYVGVELVSALTNIAYLFICNPESHNWACHLRLLNLPTMFFVSVCFLGGRGNILFFAFFRHDSISLHLPRSVSGPVRQ